MKKERLENPLLVNKDLKVKLTEPRAVPDGLFAVPFTAGMYASKGLGKTNLICNLVKAYDATKSFDKIYLWSPSCHNDPKYKLLDSEKHYYELTVYTAFDNEDFRQVLERTRADIKDYQEYQRRLAIWKKFLKVKSVNQLTPEELVTLDVDCDWEEPQTRWKYGMPSTLMIFDDLAYDRVFSSHNRMFLNFFILHRHLLVSCMLGLQSFKGTLARGLRSNLTVAMLWRQKNVEIQKEVASEFSNFISPKKLIKLWDIACKENQWDFLTVYFYANDKKYRLRKNLNELLIVDSDSESDDDEREEPKISKSTKPQHQG